MKGVEPSSPAWKAGVIAVIRHPLKSGLIAAPYQAHDFYTRKKADMSIQRKEKSGNPVETFRFGD